MRERGIPALSDYFTGQDQVDELAFLRAVMELSQRENTPPKEESSPKSVSVSHFLSNTVERFDRLREKTEEKLDKLRREKIEKELSEIQAKPVINEKSKRLLTVPFQQRTEAEIQKRQRNRLKMEREVTRLQQEEKAKVCTFKPKIQASRSQSPCFVDRVYGWLERKNKTLAREHEEKLQEELKECKEKPTISERSEAMSRKSHRSNATYRGDLSPEPASFRPQLSPNSVKIAEAVRPSGPVYLHLYSPTNGKQTPSTGGSAKMTANQSMVGRPLPKPPVRLPYSVNSSVRTATPPPVTELSFDASLSFLLKDLI